MLPSHVLSGFAILATTAAMAVRTSIPTTSILPSPTIFVAPRDIPSATSMTTPQPTGEFTTTKHITIDGKTNGVVTIPGHTIDIAIPTCVQTITPDKNGFVPPGTCGAIWDYYPSFRAAVALAVLFGALVAIHIWQAATFKKTWCWVIIMATIWEMMAMTFRALSSKSQQSDGIYLVFQIFILVTPLWVNAFAYMTLGRMIYLFHPERAIFRIPATTIAAIFVLFDIISFVIQLVGGSTAGPHAPLADQQHAIHIYMGGIGFQEIMILVFVALCVAFQVQMTRLSGSIPMWKTSWGPLLIALYVSLAMITVRIVYRLIEFSGGLGQDNALTTHEAYFYVLEAAPMFVAMGVFNIVHPGTVIKGPGSEMPGIFATIKSKMARKQGKELLDDESGDEQELVPGWKARQHAME